MMNSFVHLLFMFAISVLLVQESCAFSITPRARLSVKSCSEGSCTEMPLNAKKNSIITDKRRKQLGIADDEEEYDLDVALNNNTDPLISKIIAGSFILTMIALLAAGLVIPMTTDYGEGVCNPILNGGRC